MNIFIFMKQKYTMLLSAIDSELDNVRDAELYNNLKENVGDMRILAALIIILIIVLILLLIASKKRKRRALARKFAEYDLLAGKVEKNIKYCTEELVKANHNREKLNEVGGAAINLKGMSHFDDLTTELSTIREELKENELELSRIKKNRDKIRVVYPEAARLCKKMAKTDKKLERYLSELRDHNQSDKKLVSAQKKAFQEKERIKNSEIKCNIKISNITGLDGATGMMSAKTFAGEFRKGSYRLDDIVLLGRPGNLGSQENAGPTNLVVYGLPDKNGVLLCGDKTFRIRSANCDYTKTDKAELLSGNIYELNISTVKGNVSMRIIVQ